MKSTTNKTSHTHHSKRGMFQSQYLSKWQETFIKQGKWDKENETHTFSWWFWEEMKRQWSLKWVTRSIWEGDSWERRWIVTKSSRENEKRFKNCPCFCQTHVFCDWRESPTSRQFKPPKHSRTKVWKIFLSVFRDWKVYPRESRELSCQNLWVTLVTGPSTREQVAKNDSRRRDWGSRLDLPATESPKQGKTGFLKFSDFLNKILSKNT